MSLRNKTSNTGLLKKQTHSFVHLHVKSCARAPDASGWGKGVLSGGITWHSWHEDSNLRCYLRSDMSRTVTLNELQ